MAQDVSLAVRIATVLDAAGLNKADKQVKSFEKSLKGLGRTLGLTLSGAAVIAFSKKSVMALVEAEKANTRLANSVKNLGLSFSTAAIQKNLDEISQSAGIAGEVLVDAYQPLLTATGSVIQSQKMLNLALDVSAGSGVALTTVTQDLANAYVGNTRGLRKYNLGLSQAQLKAATFLEVQTKLNQQFSGAQAAYLDTYAGKLQILGEAAGNAQERIGATLIDLGAAFTGSSNIEEFVGKIERLTDRFVGLMDRFTEGIAIIRAMLGAKTWTGMFAAAQEAQVAEFNRRMRRDYMKVWDNTNVPMSAQALAQQRKAEAAAKKRAADLLKSQQKNTAELKKQNSLKKSATVFDLEQIQLVAALKGKLSKEEELRVQAQLALLNGNDALAKQLTEQILKAQDATGNLSKFLSALPNARNPFEYLDAYLSYLAGKAAAIAVGTPFGQAPPSGNATAAPTPSIPATNVPSMPSDGMISYNQLTGLSYNPNAGTTVVVNVAGSVTTEEDLISKIASGLQQKSLSTGDSSYINRRTGGFAG